MVKFVKNYLFLFIIVIVAFSIRSLGRNWDGGDHLHPDERFLCMVTADLRLPSTFNEYIDPKISGLSPFNHDVSFYVYGGLPITLVKTTAVTLDNVFHPDVKFDSYDGFLTVGRTYSALFDVGTLIVIYFIADKYFSRKTAIFTTLLYSLSVISIQQSNFYTMDSFAAFFMMLTLKFSLDIFYSKKIKGQVINIILTGIFLGMAIGCKFSAVVELALIGFVLFVCFIRSLKNFSFRKFLWMTFKYSLYFFILITATYFIFRLVQPFIFIDSNFFCTYRRPIFF